MPDRAFRLFLTTICAIFSNSRPERETMIALLKKLGLSVQAKLAKQRAR